MQIVLRCCNLGLADEIVDSWLNLDWRKISRSLVSLFFGNLFSRIDNAFAGIKERSHAWPVKKVKVKTVRLFMLLTGLIRVAEKMSVDKDCVRNNIPALMKLMEASSFGNHLLNWPRGYAGDFKIINLMVDKDEGVDPESMEGVISRCALNSPIVQQHREKLRLQADMIREVCQKFENPRILSVACGSSRDMESVQDVIKKSGAKVFLVDNDQGALDDSLARLSAVSDQITAIKANVVRKLPKIMKDLEKENGKFHLIYAGGLFDYLSDEIIDMMLGYASKFVKAGGFLMFTNIAKGNPFKLWMEALGNWFLIERSEDQMKEFLKATNFAEQSLELDPTGLTWVARAKND